MVETKAQSTHSYSFINALRGIAALLVALLHFFINTQQYYKGSSWVNTLEPFLLGKFDIGKFAVGVFFLVSGFLIPYSLERSRSISKFVVHRVFRLYPAYWFSIILFLLLNFWFSYTDKPRLVTTLANLTMLQGYIRQPDLIGAFWTLQIELTFYILCVFLFWFGLSKNPTRVAYSFLVISIIASAFTYKGVKIPNALFIALQLMYCADALRRKSLHVRRLWIVTALSLVLICFLAYGELSLRYTLSYWAAMLAFYLTYNFQNFEIFSHRAITFLADISYSVYLLHDPIGIQIAINLSKHGFPPIISYVAAYLATIFASWIVFKFIEKPAIDLGKKVTSNQKIFRHTG